ncbi:MAG TPA: M14 family zinc carboxypeptidase [Pyrinomonadaceae bacterium]|nr:M14 family zinc carboxypeptidase [Pyrinomonadaceae bacterium]
MNRERLFLIARALFAFVAVVAGLLLLADDAGRVSAQKSTAESSHPRTAATAKVTSPVSAVDADNDYSKRIKEYTTESYFRTELVDHLPMSNKVPSPDKVLGYVVGTPNKLTYSKDLYRYYRELARTTPRVRVFSASEKSEEGKEQMLVAVGDEDLLAKLDHYKDITAKLADPRKINEQEASALIGEGKIFYWASGSIHSPETGSCEMLMELAYRLAVEESPFIQAIRKNVIVLITPVLEVDGRDMMVDTYNYRKANPGKNFPGLIFWGKYVAHDNNRDGLGMALALTRNQMKTFLEYHPAVLHDLHESVPFLYTSTGTGPYNAWLDPITIDEWQLLAYHEIEEMTKRGVPGVWTHGFYDGWAPNYMFYVANGHNAIGRFYETFGNGGADTIDRTVSEQSRRDWFRPNPAQPRVKWSIRNNINLQQSAILLAMNFVSSNKERFLQNFYIKSKRSVAKALNEGPYAYVIPADQSRLVEAADMVNLLRLMGVEVHRADKEIAVKDQKFPAGSYVIRMDQPYSRMADMMLDTQYYNVTDPRPYDDTGWTLGALRNVKTVRVADKSDQSILKAPMTLLTADARVSGKINGSAIAGYLINHNTENTLATLRFKLKDVKIEAAEDSFKVGERNFNAGTFIVKTEGNGSNLRQRLDEAMQELGLTAQAVDKLPDVKSHELAVPRIAILHTWTNTQNDGWYRIEFDKFQIPYSYISDQVVRNTPNLREKYDVIIFPPLNGSSQSIVNGIPMRGDAIPWKQSELTPNMGLSPDQTDDMRGGMGLAGVLNLQKFVADGGLFIAVANTTRLPIDFGLTTGVSIQEPRLLQARGSIYNARFSDRKSPIAYGYDETMPIYFNQAPLFQVAAGPGGGAGGGGGGGGEGGPGAATGRPSGRGSLTDPDIVQGMPLAASSPRPSPRPGEEQLTDEQRLQLGAYYTPPNQRPRVVLRFAADEKTLLISGMLAGGSELANAPAVIDVPVGRGHVVMFANNPMWRHQTQGSFFLVFNAVLNFDSLNTERAVQTPARPAPTSGDDNE